MNLFEVVLFELIRSGLIRTIFEEVLFELIRRGLIRTYSKVVLFELIRRGLIRTYSLKIVSIRPPAYPLTCHFVCLLNMSYILCYCKPFVLDEK